MYLKKIAYENLLLCREIIIQDLTIIFQMRGEYW